MAKTKKDDKPMTRKEFASLGGKATLKKHGKKFYQQLAQRRWRKAK